VARLIPSFAEDGTPPGERDVFTLLSTGPDDWSALHSLDLAPWNGRRRTEIDFLILVPDTGILCIEVKSHSNISYDGDRWYPPSISRSPFKQALDGRFALHRRLSVVSTTAKRIPVVHCTIFPNARFDLAENLSVSSDEFMDARAFRLFRTGFEFCADLKIRMRRLINADPSLHPMVTPLRAEEVSLILSYCAPVQRRHPELREQVRKQQRELDELLRDQQKPVLKLASSNPRVMISGGAGTGKTLIAIEVARRAAETGQRVALLCYNRLVGEWLSQKTRVQNASLPNMIVDRAYRVMAEMAHIKIPNDPPPSWWERDLIDQLEERVTDTDFRWEAQFDYLVLDEAQDILSRPRLWACLQEFLRGGLERGQFAMFGDFENQIFGDTATLQVTLADTKRRSGAVNFHLDENCRNLRIVGDTAVRMSGFSSSTYSGYRRTGGSSADLALKEYDTAEEQKNDLAQFIRDLRKSGYQDSDITVLSFRQASGSAAVLLAKEGFRLHPVGQGDTGIGYASVAAFKGMENKAIILTDLVAGDQGFHRHLFYVAMTRSAGPVRILCQRGLIPVLESWIKESTNG
jgi:hypothetical protein